MDASLEHLSSRLLDLRSKVTELEPAPSLSSLSSSNSDSSSLDCPSLTTSNTSSSDGLTELETDLDGDVDDVWLGSPPSIGPTHDLTRELTGALSGLQLQSRSNVEGGPVPDTPRPIRVERRGYFPQVGREGEDGYESEGESVLPKRGWGVVGKRRLGIIKRRKTSALRGTDEHDSENMRLVSEVPASPVVDGQGAHESEEPLQDMGLVHPRTPANTPILADASVPSIPLPVKRLYAGLGLDLPSMWNGDSTPRVNASPSEVRLPTSQSYEDSPYPSSFQGSDEESEGPGIMGCKKVIIQPMDAVLAFVTTPSPMEELPTPILSFSDNADDACEVQDLQTVESVESQLADVKRSVNSTSSGRMDSVVGLGLYLDFSS